MMVLMDLGIADHLLTHAGVPSIAKPKRRAIPVNRYVPSKRNGFDSIEKMQYGGRSGIF